jgi:hypothetical protein
VAYKALRLRHRRVRQKLKTPPRSHNPRRVLRSSRKTSRLSQLPRRLPAPSAACRSSDLSRRSDQGRMTAGIPFYRVER